MVRSIPDQELEKLIDSPNWSPIEISKLKVGDEIITEIGTYQGLYRDDDWRWIKGFIINIKPATRIIKPMRPGEKIKQDRYEIIKISSYKNKILQKLLPALTIDVSQKLFGVCCGRIFKYANQTNLEQYAS